MIKINKGRCELEGTPAGDGMLDIHRLNKYLRQDISCIIELWTPWQGNIDETIAVESEWAERSAGYLRSVL